MLALSSFGKAAIGLLAEAMHEPKWETRDRAAGSTGKDCHLEAVKPLIAGLRHMSYSCALHGGKKPPRISVTPMQSNRSSSS